MRKRSVSGFLRTVRTTPSLFQSSLVSVANFVRDASIPWSQLLQSDHLSQHFRDDNFGLVTF
jgi:hypothetical protein